MDNLIAWLNAQIDDDEQLAEAAFDRARHGEWEYRPGSDDGVYAAGGAIEIFRSDAYGYTRLGNALGEHIARQDPDRSLREVAAKRKVLALHPHQRFQHPLRAESPFEEDRRPAFAENPRYVGCKLCHWDPRMEELSPGWWCEHVRAIVSVYSDRPGFRDEWRLT